MRLAGSRRILPRNGETFVPGRHINDHQKRLFMRYRQTDGVALAAARAGFSTAAGYRLERHRLNQRQLIPTAKQAADMRTAPAGAVLISVTSQSSGWLLRRRAGSSAGRSVTSGLSALDAPPALRHVRKSKLAVRPPSTMTSAPSIAADPVERRNIAARATSAASRIRPPGCRAVRVARNCSASGAVSR